MLLAAPALLRGQLPCGLLPLPWVRALIYVGAALDSSCSMHACVGGRSWLWHERLLLLHCNVCCTQHEFMS